MPVAADEALTRLLDGNARYAAGHERRLVASVVSRQRLIEGQDPFAVVLTCSDSRVVPELIFDAALGDLFVVRVAGHIVDTAVLGSIEYAMGQLNSKLVIVVGHQSCGAVEAAVFGDPTDTHIDELVEAIAPAVEVARGMDGDLLANAIVENARLVAGNLRVSEPVMAGHVAEDVRVVAAIFSFETGRVTLV